MEDRAEQKRLRTTSTRQDVAELLARGHTVTEIARRLNLSKPTICHHARRLGDLPSAKFARRCDWAEVQRYYDAGHTVRGCREHFGFANQTWNNAVKRGDVVARARAIPMDELLVAGRIATSRFSLKLRLLATGLKRGRCEECGWTSGVGTRFPSRFTMSTASVTTTAWPTSNCSVPTATARPRTSPDVTEGAPPPDEAPRGSRPVGVPFRPCLKPKPSPADNAPAGCSTRDAEVEPRWR